MNKYLLDYYNLYCNEDNRLLSKHGQIEYITTMKYILKYIPKGKIIELGAGTGRYSIELARQGYQVTALELIDHNIEILKSKLTNDDNLHNRLDVLQGNALDLSRFEEDLFDACLILGPMYHLYTVEDKIKVLTEAKRITKKNGYIFVAYCMNEATIIQWGFKNEGENILEALDKKMLTKEYHCISKEEDIFEMVRIEEINHLNNLCNLERVKLIGTDMFTNYIRDKVDNMNQKVFDVYLDYHLKICERQDIVGVSNHTLDILINKK